MSKKVQKNIVTLLAVILVVISLVSTSIVLGKITFEVEQPRTPQLEDFGEVMVKILGPPQSVESSGEVSLTVEPYEES